MAMRRAADQRKGPALKIVKWTARNLGVTPQTVREYIRRYPEVAATKREIEETYFAEVGDILAAAKADLAGRPRSNREAEERGERRKVPSFNAELLNETLRELQGKWTGLAALDQ